MTSQCFVDRVRETLRPQRENRFPEEHGVETSLSLEMLEQRYQTVRGRPWEDGCGKYRTGILEARLEHPAEALKVAVERRSAHARMSGDLAGRQALVAFSQHKLHERAHELLARASSAAVVGLTPLYGQTASGSLLLARSGQGVLLVQLLGHIVRYLRPHA